MNEVEVAEVQLTAVETAAYAATINSDLEAAINNMLSSERKHAEITIACKTCKEHQQKAEDCCNATGKSSEPSKVNESSLVMSMPAHVDWLADKDIWIADSGATSHNTPHSEGLQDIKQPLKTDAGTGARAKTVKVDTTKGSMCDKHGNAMIINASLQDVIIVPKSKFDLLSIPVFLEKGWELKGNADNTKLIKENAEMRFDIKIKTTRGSLHCVKFARKVATGEMQNIAAPATMKGTEMIYEKAHDLFSHAGKEMTMKIAKK